jgi:hypothetical protein
VFREYLPILSPCPGHTGRLLLWFKYEMPPQAHVLKAWSLVGAVILGGGRNFRRLGLARRGGSLKVYLWRSYLVPDPFLCLSLLSGCHEEGRLYHVLCHYDILPHLRLKAMDSDDLGLKHLKLWASLVFLRYLSQGQKVWVAQKTGTKKWGCCCDYYLTMWLRSLRNWLVGRIWKSL